MIPMKYTCPHCKVNATKVRYDKFHGDNCRKLRSSRRPVHFDINKYTELHDRLMAELGSYYNNHIHFMNQPSKWSSRPLVSNIMELGRVIRDIKRNNYIMRKQLAEKIAEKKETIAIKKAAKKLRKQNGNDSIN